MKNDLPKQIKANLWKKKKVLSENSRTTLGLDSSFAQWAKVFINNVVEKLWYKNSLNKEVSICKKKNKEIQKWLWKL
jgi:hypothetical protein